MKKRTLGFNLVLLVALLLLSGCIFSGADPAPPDTIEMVDVSPDDWFYPYIVAGLRFGLIEGESGGYFEPDRNVTVAEFVTMLGRLHEYGNDTIGTPGEGEPYERYLNWAAELELDITRVRRRNQGVEYIEYVQYIDLALPNESITREQMAVMVSRYISTFELWDYFRHGFAMGMISFGDFDTSDWALGTIELLRTSLLVYSEPGENRFRPRDYATRAEVVEILVKVCSAVYDLRHPMQPCPYQ